MVDTGLLFLRSSILDSTRCDVLVFCRRFYARDGLAKGRNGSVQSFRVGSGAVNQARCRRHERGRDWPKSRLPVSPKLDESRNLGLE